MLSGLNCKLCHRKVSDANILVKGVCPGCVKGVDVKLRGERISLDILLGIQPPKGGVA